ncbi:MAG: bacillithiol system redox-active protein YtxJ [Candidatus Hydrogenedentes bacterium]|nr:bacillithiol system redox-active protein YtxJ [Candidatus Hydrogenedentota bacterium]
MTEITTIDQLDACLKTSGEKPVFIFKHSTRCPISSGANARIAKFLLSKEDENEALPEFYLLKVVESRAVSNALADQLHVPHQSPQLLLIDNEKCTWHTSHHNINALNIEKAIQSATA